MSDQIESNSPSKSIDFETIHSKISELRSMDLSSVDVNEKLVKDCADELQGKLDEMMICCSDISALSVNDLDLCLEHLKGELSTVEAENSSISNEIEDLKRTYLKDSCQLESDLELLECTGLERAKAGPNLDGKANENQMSSLCANQSSQFKILELSNQIEKNESILKSLEDLDRVLNRFDAMENIEDALTGLKVIEIENNNIKLSLTTYVPYLENLFSQLKIEDMIPPYEQTHELVLELVDGTMEPKNAEIFPSDVYINEIVDAAKSFRRVCSPLPLLETRSPLEWFIRKVQDRIVLSILRRVVVKSANKSRHSIEYIERDDSIVAHMVGGVDAFMKVHQNWPLDGSPLKLISLKNSSPHSKEISLSFLCKVEEAANSLEKKIQQNISSFVDAIEEILVKHMRAELHSVDNTSVL
ncbi:centrosomal protein of 290 kDa-like [Heracleum sosnowskyi]|uniref:Centrosomal protein of 290 kDa-like n=1 Tax=Heracleum sosnowskyi TaxID=360622 RepID=A0AAD8MLX0_9APIA|nr:centrosomal protein of 290 kDa-like [Heracleum sosnowskyi]